MLHIWALYVEITYVSQVKFLDAGIYVHLTISLERCRHHVIRVLHITRRQWGTVLLNSSSKVQHVIEPKF